MAFSLEHRYSVTKDDAKARVQALAEYLDRKHGIKATWEGDRARVNGRYLVVTIEGSIAVEPGIVKFEGKDPGFLWRGKAKEYLENKLRQYLDAATPLDKLPRA